MTKIEWTHIPGMKKGRTWNPVVGCSVISPGCTNCYAMRGAARQVRMAEGAGRTSHYQDLTIPTKAGPVWTGAVRMAPDHILTAPLRVRAPTPWFVNSMGDLFHESVSDAEIDRVFAVMALCPQHIFIVLTKRPERMRDYFTQDGNFGRWGYIEHRAIQLADRHAPKIAAMLHGKTLAGYGGANLPNVWLGVSAEDQTRLDERAPELLATPAAVRLISAEPLLGSIDLTPYLYICTHKDDAALAAGKTVLPFNDPETTDPRDISTPRIDWVIAGGESGPGARPMHPDWVRQVRDQCADADVPFFFKQWGEWAPDTGPQADGADPIMDARAQCAWFKGGRWYFEDSGYDVPLEYAKGAGEWVYRLGKKRARDLLDGVQHHNWPKTQHTEETK